MKNTRNLSRPRRLAVFLATSGHSGVDRIMGLLLPQICSRGILVDLLHVKGKGPYLPPNIENLRVIELGSSHSFTSLIPVLRYLKKERPDALLSDKDRVNQVALIARDLAGVPTRVAVRSGTTISMALKNRGTVEKLRHYLSMKFLYRRADAVITASHGSALDLSHFSTLPLEKITVIPNPIDLEKLAVLASETVSHPWFSGGSVPVIVGMGELGGSKDHETLISAFAELRKNRPAHLFIMGGGRGREKLEALSRNLGLSEDIELFGFTDNPFPLLARADLFVLSSHYEGFGMALLEALSLGIPSVSTDCPNGPAEILQGGRYGRLVPVGAVEEMAKAMTLTLDEPQKPDFLKQVTVPYALETVTDQYLRILGLDPEY